MPREYFTKILEELEEDSLKNLIKSLCKNDYYLDGSYEEFETFLKKYNYKLIERYGGGEGGSEDCSSVFQFDDKYYRAEYYYYSYDGYYYDDIVSTLREVFPIVRPTTYYE